MATSNQATELIEDQWSPCLGVSGGPNGAISFPDNFEPLFSFTDDLVDDHKFEEDLNDEELDFSDVFSAAVEEHLISKSANSFQRWVTIFSFTCANLHEDVLPFRTRVLTKPVKGLEKTSKVRMFGKRPRWRPMSLNRAVRSIPRNRCDIRTEYMHMIVNILNQCTVKSLVGFISKFCGKSFRLTTVITDETHMSPHMCQPCNMSFFNIKTAAGYWGLLVNTVPDLMLDFGRAQVIEDKDPDGNGNRRCKVVCSFHQVFTRIVLAPPHDMCNMVHLVAAMQEKMILLKAAGVDLLAAGSWNSQTMATLASNLPPGIFRLAGSMTSTDATTPMHEVVNRGDSVRHSTTSAPTSSTALETENTTSNDLLQSSLPESANSIETPVLICGHPLPAADTYDPTIQGLPPGVQLPAGLSLPPGINLLPTGSSLSPGLSGLVTGVTAFVAGLGDYPSVVPVSSSMSVSSGESSGDSSAGADSSDEEGESSPRQGTNERTNEGQIANLSSSGSCADAVDPNVSSAAPTPSSGANPAIFAAIAQLIPAMLISDSESRTGSSIADAILRMIALKQVPVPHRLPRPVRHNIVGTVTLQLNARKGIESVEFLGKPMDAIVL